MEELTETLYNSYTIKSTALSRQWSRENPKLGVSTSNYLHHHRFARARLFFSTSS